MARQELRLRGTTDYWVNVLDGQPCFLASRPADPGLPAETAGQPTAAKRVADPR